MSFFDQIFKKIGKIFSENYKKIYFFAKFIKKIAKLAKISAIVPKNIIQNIFFTSMEYFCGLEIIITR